MLRTPLTLARHCFAKSRDQIALGVVSHEGSYDTTMYHAPPQKAVSMSWRTV